MNLSEHKIQRIGQTYVPDFRPDTTDGRMQSGGTSMRVRIKSFGRPQAGFITNNGMSSSGIRASK
jgi:hypothetical protein